MCALTGLINSNREACLPEAPPREIDTGVTCTTQVPLDAVRAVLDCGRTLTYRENDMTHWMGGFDERG